jgi:hypothetical protein
MEMARYLGIAAVTASLVVVTAHAPARAEPVCVALTAQVTSVFDSTGVLGGDITVGDTISGVYSYESTTPDTHPESTFGDYVQTKAPFGITLNAGGIVFRTDPKRVNYFIAIANDFPTLGGFEDLYSINSFRNNIFEKEIAFDERTGEIRNDIVWGLADPDRHGSVKY